MQCRDLNLQVGAVIVNKTKKIVGIGYNGMPNGCHDDNLPWQRTGDWLDTKYPYGRWCIQYTVLLFLLGSQGFRAALK